MPISSSKWKDAVTAAKLNLFASEALKKVTSSFATYEQRKTQASLENLASDFENWRLHNNAEVLALGDAVAGLEDTITADRNANVVIADRATNIGEVGYTFEADPQWFGKPVPVIPPQRVPAIGNTLMMKVNDSFRVAKQSVAAAVARLARTSNNGNADLLLYEEWFGAYNLERFIKVRSNFVEIDRVCESLPFKFVDARNDNGKKDWYACCYPDTNPAEIYVWIGRLFFDAGPDHVRDAATQLNRYNTMILNSAGTLVHEYSHAILDTDDEPIVGGGVDINGDALVANDADTDRDLATHEPDRAINNADNYCQYAIACYHLSS